MSDQLENEQFLDLLGQARSRLIQITSGIVDSNATTRTEETYMSNMLGDFLQFTARFQDDFCDFTTHLRDPAWQSGPKRPCSKRARPRNEPEYTGIAPPKRNRPREESTSARKSAQQLLEPGVEQPVDVREGRRLFRATSTEIVPVRSVEEEEMQGRAGTRDGRSKKGRGRPPRDRETGR